MRTPGPTDPSCLAMHIRGPCISARRTPPSPSPATRPRWDLHLPLPDRTPAPFHEAFNDSLLVRCREHIGLRNALSPAAASLGFSPTSARTAYKPIRPVTDEDDCESLYPCSENQSSGRTKAPRQSLRSMAKSTSYRLPWSNPLSQKANECVKIRSAAYSMAIVRSICCSGCRC